MIGHSARKSNLELPLNLVNRYIIFLLLSIFSTQELTIQTENIDYMYILYSQILAPI